MGRKIARRSGLRWYIERELQGRTRLLIWDHVYGRIARWQDVHSLYCKNPDYYQDYTHDSLRGSYRSWVAHWVSGLVRRRLKHGYKDMPQHIKRRIFHCPPAGVVVSGQRRYYTCKMPDVCPHCRCRAALKLCYRIKDLMGRGLLLSTVFHRVILPQGVDLRSKAAEAISIFRQHVFLSYQPGRTAAGGLVVARLSPGWDSVALGLGLARLTRPGPSCGSRWASDEKATRSIRPLACMLAYDIGWLKAAPAISWSLLSTSRPRLFATFGAVRAGSWRKIT